MLIELVDKSTKSLFNHVVDLQKQNRYACARATNDVLFMANKALPNEIKRTFDNPTPYVMRAFYVDKATKSNLVGRIALKDRGTPEDKKRLNDLLLTQIEGGRRQDKFSELKTRKYNDMPSSHNLIPTRTARKNKYGNLTKRMLEKIFKSVAASRVKQGSGTDKFFYGEVNGVSGIWENRGKRLRLWFLEIRRPVYKPRFDFYGFNESIVKKNFFKRHEEWLDRAIRTAR